MKWVKNLGICLIALLLTASAITFVHAQSADELKQQIAEYEAQITKLQSQANTLANQIAQYNTQIQLTQLKIKKAEEEIARLGGRIESLEVSLESLNVAFASRAAQTYKMTRLGEPVMLLITADDLTKAVSSFHYLQKIQQADRDLLVRLQDAQAAYKDEKVNQEELQTELKDQQAVLAAQKTAKNDLLSVTKSDEKKYQELLAQAKAQLAAFKSFTTIQGGASILQNQTKCDGWGCYYNQRDSQWGTLGLGGSPYSVAEYGCLVTSVSMMASHYGKNIKPIDIALVSTAFVPGTGYLYHSFTVNGINVQLSTISKSQLDSELAAGRPVIAGLYGGPDHFIVILKKEGDNYIMHDPFMPDGANRPLTDNYSVNDITTLRSVSFN